MPQKSIFTWPQGGSLVLSGGGDFRRGQTDEVDTSVLRRALSDNPLAYLIAGPGKDAMGEDFLEYIQELGGPTGFMVDLLEEDIDSIQEQLAEVGIIVLGDAISETAWPRLLAGPIHESLAGALAAGTTIYAQGRLAGLFGAWYPGPLMGLMGGLAWLDNSLIYAPYQAEKRAILGDLLQNYAPAAFGLGLAPGSALALTAEGGVEIWGGQEVTILLGPHFKTAEGK
jgi:hypothetical protein